MAVADARPRIVVLGGGSPFTAKLIDTLAAVSTDLPPCVLVLWGRSESRLELLAEYGRNRLVTAGWSVAVSSDLAEALTGSSVIVHQVRYGGMQGRAAAEDFCARFGITADETLGPAALLIALLGQDDLTGVLRRIAVHAPGAWVLNLTNPLSSVVTTMDQVGIKRCIGLCELPLVTIELAATILGRPLSQLSYSYEGLNHRGFLHGLSHQGRDLLPELADRLDADGLFGIGPEEIRSLQAIPLKYHRLLSGPSHLVIRRAAALMTIRERILRELHASTSDTPPSLDDRNMDWYARSVVPALLGLLGSYHAPIVVNQPASNGLVREYFARISGGRIERIESEPLSGPAAEWLKVFERHELAFQRAVSRPSLKSVTRALAEDPVVPDEQVADVAESLWQEYRLSSHE